MTGNKTLFAVLLWILPITSLAATVLPVQVRNALAFRNVPDEALSIYVEDLATGNVVLTWNAAEPRNPASVEKMVTTLVAAF